MFCPRGLTPFMLIHIHFFVLLACLTCSGPVIAATQTFGLDDGRAALASRPSAAWVKEAQSLEKRGDWQGLLAWGQDWAQIDDKNPLPWFVQGRALGELGRTPEAIAAYQRNVSLAPRDALARNNLGNAYRDSGRPREAMLAYRAEAGVTQALQKLQATNPVLADVWRALAIEYSITRDERVARRAVRVLRGLSSAERKRMFGILFDDS